MIGSAGKAARSSAMTSGVRRPAATLMMRAPAWIFSAASLSKRVIVAINASGEPATVHFDAQCGRAVDLITGEEHDFGGGSELAPFSAYYWRCER